MSTNPKLVKVLQKKLRQIDELKTRQSSGAGLNGDQLAKLQREPQLRAELAAASGGSSLKPAGPALAKGAANPAPPSLKRKPGSDGGGGGGGGGGDGLANSDGPSQKKKKKKRKRLPPKIAKGLSWVRSAVVEHGPILLSMLGRMFTEKHRVGFKSATGETMLSLLEMHPGDLTVTALKGAEKLVQAPPTSAVGRPCAIRSRLQADDEADSDGEGGVLIPPPYRRGDKILCVGEGNFTWSSSVAAAMGEGKGLVATSYEALATVMSRHGAPAKKALRDLDDAGAAVLHEVDATHLELRWKSPTFDFVVFQFPHTGSDGGVVESIRSNRALLRSFFKSAAALLLPGGEIHVTIVNRYPYTAWKPATAAAKGNMVPSLEYCGTVPFEHERYPGYSHVTSTMVGHQTSYAAEAAYTHVWKRL